MGQRLPLPDTRESQIDQAPDWDMSWAGGAGALYSTVGDLFRWNEALFGGRDAAGHVNAVHHTQNGMSFRAPKIEESSAFSQPQQLDAIVGEYQYGPSSVMTVTRDGTQLFAQLTGQPKFPIFAKSSSEFEWHIVPASVRFVKGQDGKIIKAVHTQGGRTFDAPKIE